MDGYNLDKDICVAVTAFVIKTQEFSFSNGSKKALKLFIDADGYISEKVLWPDYEYRILKYPNELKKEHHSNDFFKKARGSKIEKNKKRRKKENTATKLYSSGKLFLPALVSLETNGNYKNVYSASTRAYETLWHDNGLHVSN